MNKLTHAQQIIAANARLPYVAAIKERDVRIAELEAALMRADSWVSMYHDMPGHDAASKCMTEFIRKTLYRGSMSPSPCENVANGFPHCAALAKS